MRYALVVLVGAAVVYFGMRLLNAPSPAAPEPGWVSPRVACLEVVRHPDTFLCPDKHGWQDIGPVTPVPPIPAG